MSEIYKVAYFREIGTQLYYFESFQYGLVEAQRSYFSMKESLGYYPQFIINTQSGEVVFHEGMKIGEVICENGLERPLTYTELDMIVRGESIS